MSVHSGLVWTDHSSPMEAASLAAGPNGPSLPAPILTSHVTHDSMAWHGCKWAQVSLKEGIPLRVAVVFLPFPLAWFWFAWSFWWLCKPTNKVSLTLRALHEIRELSSPSLNKPDNSCHAIWQIIHLAKTTKTWPPSRKYQLLVVWLLLLSKDALLVIGLDSFTWKPICQWFNDSKISSQLQRPLHISHFLETHGTSKHAVWRAMEPSDVLGT